MTEFGFIDQHKRTLRRSARQRVRRNRRRLRRAPRRGGRIAGLHDRHARRRRPFPASRNFAPRTGAQIPCRKPERRRFDGRPPGGHPAVAVAPGRHGRHMGRRVHARLPGTLRSVRRHARRGRHDPLGGRASRSMSRPSAASPTHTSSAAAGHAPATRYSSPENSDFRAPGCATSSPGATTPPPPQPTATRSPKWPKASGSAHAPKYTP